MAEHTAPPAQSLYLSHKFEVEKVESTKNQLYKIFEELFVGCAGSTPYVKEMVAEELKANLKAHEVALVTFAKGLLRNKQNFERQEEAYQQEALEDAAADGYIVNGWPRV